MRWRRRARYRARRFERRHPAEAMSRRFNAVVAALPSVVHAWEGVARAIGYCAGELELLARFERGGPATLTVGGRSFPIDEYELRLHAPPALEGRAELVWDETWDL